MGGPLARDHGHPRGASSPGSAPTLTRSWCCSTPLTWTGHLPEALLVSQAVIVATGAIPASVLGRRWLGDDRLAVAAAAVYLLHLLLMWTTVAEFHPVTLAAPLLLWCVWAAWRSAATRRPPGQDVVLEPLASAEAVISTRRRSSASSSSTSAAGPPTSRCSATAPCGTRRLAARRRPHHQRHRRSGCARRPRTPRTSRKRDGCALTALVREEETVDVPAVGGRKARQLSRQHPVRDHPAARRGDLHPGSRASSPRAGLQDAARRASCVTGGTRSWRECPSSPSRSSTCRCAAACRSASAGWRTWCRARSTRPGWGWRSTARGHARRASRPARRDPWAGRTAAGLDSRDLF